jgi:hypothetical protein
MLEIYNTSKAEDPKKCTDPYAALGNPISQAEGRPVVQGVGNPVSEAVGVPVHINRSINDTSFGTQDNLDECQVPLVDIPRVWTTECPGGGLPVPKYGQCGGADWDGPKCCFGYSVCVQVQPRRALVFLLPSSQKFLNVRQK